MDDSRKRFIFIEAVLAIMVLVLAVVMLKEQRGEAKRKVSVIVQDSDNSQWSAFRYGLKMAAEDQGIEVFVVSTGDGMTVDEEIDAVKYEINHGADAIIVQPVSGTDMEGKLKKLEKKVPVMLVGNTASHDRDSSKLPTTEPDNYAMGQAVAEELLADYNGNLKGKAIEIVTADGGSESAVSRRKGFQEVLEGSGADIAWSLHGVFGDSEQGSLKNQPRADIVVALDDASLTAAGEYSAAKDLHGALLYGIGNSTEAVYYLDTGIVECLVVPDEFSAGYQSLTEVAKSLQGYFHKMQDTMLSYTVLRKEELFTEKNQEILFTLSQ